MKRKSARMLQVFYTKKQLRINPAHFIHYLINYKDMDFSYNQISYVINCKRHLKKHRHLFRADDVQGNRTCFIRIVIGEQQKYRKENKRKQIYGQTQWSEEMQKYISLYYGAKNFDDDLPF